MWFFTNFCNVSYINNWIRLKFMTYLKSNLELPLWEQCNYNWFHGHEPLWRGRKEIQEVKEQTLKEPVQEEKNMNLNNSQNSISSKSGSFLVQIKNEN
jgi:hypothetical protein